MEFAMKSVSRAYPTDTTATEETITFDDMLFYLGEFGLYQKALFAMLFFFCSFLSFVYFTQIFITVVPVEHWCKLPSVSGWTDEQVRDRAIPSAKRVPYEGHELPYSRCWMYDLPLKKLLATIKPDDNWPLKRCDDWYFKYSSHDVPYASIATEQKWVCDETYKRTLSESIFFTGAICGGFIFGWLADKYGRIPVLIGTNMMGFIGGLSTIFANHYWEYCFCRFIVGFAFDNTFVVAYILVLEYVGPRWRTYTANMSYGIFYTIAGCGLPWVAYVIADWKNFALVTSIPLVSILIIPFIVPESCRWLISKGKLERAVGIMSQIERVNKTNVPQDIYEKFLDDCVETAEILEAEEYTLLDLFKTGRLRRITILLTICWSIIAMAYDAHIRSLGSLGMDVFSTFTITFATEFPAVILITYTLDVWGRRWCMFGSAILSGLFTFSAAGWAPGLGFACFALFGRFFINITSNIALQYAAELLPTVIRGEGVAFIHIMGYVATIISPFVVFTSSIQYNMPMFILGSSTIVAAILVLFLPETLDEQLPQTLLEGELFGIDQSFWETPFSRRRRMFEPRGHHMHALRPISRAAVLRSSIASVYTGFSRRVSKLKDRASTMIGGSNRRSIASSPLEYLAQLRASRREGENWRDNN